MLHLAIANTMMGASGDAIPALQGGIAAWRAAGAELFVPYFLFRLAEAQRGAGDLDAAQAAIDEALAEVERRNERFVEAELLRLRAEVSLELDPSKTEDAERILRRAVDVAHRQGARTSELRATTSLHRLYVGSGRAVEHEAALRALVDTFGDAALPDLADACAALGTVRTSSERGAS
jgi:predicted ATPase